MQYWMPLHASTEWGDRRRNQCGSPGADPATCALELDAPAGRQLASSACVEPMRISSTASVDVPATPLHGHPQKRTDREPRSLATDAGIHSGLDRSTLLHSMLPAHLPCFRVLPAWCAYVIAPRRHHGPLASRLPHCSEESSAVGSGSPANPAGESAQPSRTCCFRPSPPRPQTPNAHFPSPLSA